MIGNIGPLEIGIVLVIALVVFGPRRLPELGNGLGRGMREFKETVTGERKGDDDDAKALPASEVTTARTPAPTPVATASVEAEVAPDRHS
jgi:sec-independent protein translocase protein TatA